MEYEMPDDKNQGNGGKDQGPDPRQINMHNREIVLRESQPVLQKIATLTQATAAWVAGTATTLNIPLKNAGLIRKLYVRVVATVVQSAAETHTRTHLGPANFFSQVILTDLNNIARINTTGWHLAMMAAARRAAASFAANTTDTPMGFGANYNVLTAPASFTTAQNVYMFYEIPLAYSDKDLRGAIFANVNNATMNLQLTINPNLSVGTGVNPSQAMYQSSTAARFLMTAYTIEVYQEYLDQLPKNREGRYVLPRLDLQTQYTLLNIVNTGLIVGADFSLPYANFRKYMSTIVMYDNAGVLNAGTDLNYISLQTANAMDVFKADPFTLQAIYGRGKISDDWPRGVYYFDHRANPIDTKQYGNMQLNINPSAVTAGAQLVAGYEYFAIQSQLLGAGAMANN
jgi:hypothetical protein